MTLFPDFSAYVGVFTPYHDSARMTRILKMRNAVRQRLFRQV